jgi:hypothetical protein
VVASARPQTPETSAGNASVLDAIACFEAIDLAAMGEGNLQDRIDTKYLLDVRELPALLKALQPHYRVLEVAGARLMGYQTLYFDTPEFSLYQAQHNGRPDRYKARSRRYVQTRQAFLEVKHKNVQSRTLKNRIATPELMTELDDDARAFFALHLPAVSAALEPKLWNRYRRVTLAAHGGGERITFDLDIGFGKELITTGLPGLVVAELKQDRVDRDSPFRLEMRARGVRPIGFSKYCVGAALLHPTLKHNRFKPELLRAQRISERYLTQ